MYMVKHRLHTILFTNLTVDKKVPDPGYLIAAMDNNRSKPIVGNRNCFLLVMHSVSHGTYCSTQSGPLLTLRCVDSHMI